MSNPNLKKIIKLTQAQYDILSNGGTVGDYTGLNDNYLYLIQSDSPDLPVVGSGDKNKYLHTNSSTGNLEWVDLTNITITTTTGSESISDGTNTLNVMTRDTDQTIDSSKTIAVNKSLSFTGENYTGSIENNSNRLFLKYSGNNKLGVGNSDATFYVTARPGTSNTYDLGTSSLNWKDLYLGGKGYIKDVDPGSGQVLYLGNSTGVSYLRSDFLPSSTGTKNLGSSSYKWGNLYLDGNIVNGYATITNDTNYFTVRATSGNATILYANTTALNTRDVRPMSDDNNDLGYSTYRYKDLYLSGGLRDGNNNNYKLVLPDSTSWTASKTIATIDQIPTVDYPVTNVTVNNTSVVTNKVAILGALAGKDKISSTDIASGYYLPSQYISQASASGNTLTLTSVGGTSLTYTPTFTEQHVGDVVSVGATSGTHIAISGTIANPTVGVESGYSIPSNTNQTNWSNKYDKPSTGIPASDLAEEYYLASNPNGYTSNTGTVTSVRVQAGTGLVSSQSTAQTSILNTTISIDSGYKLPTTSEWNSKADASAIPTVNDGALTISVNGTSSTFSANQSTNTSVSINTPQIEDWRS